MTLATRFPCGVCRGLGWSLGAAVSRDDARDGDCTCEACGGNGDTSGVVVDYPGVLTPDPIVRVVLFGSMARLCEPARRAELIARVDRDDRFGVRRAGRLSVLVMLAGPGNAPRDALAALARDLAPFDVAGIIPADDDHCRP